MAIDMLFSPDYLKMKAGIMEPIDRFFELMEKRTNDAVVEATESVRRFRLLTMTFLGMLFILSLASSWTILRLRYLNEEKWTKPLLQSGWSAIPNIIIEKQALIGLDPTDLNIVIHLLRNWTNSNELPSPTVEKIAKDIGISVRTVQKHLADLQQSGLITRIERRNTRFGSAPNLYRLDGLIDAAKPFTGTDALPRLREPNPFDTQVSASPSTPEPANFWARVLTHLGLTER